MTWKATHGHTSGGKITREFRSWCAMIQRCTDPNTAKWARYGGRGITICPAWLNGFEAFFRDMGNCPAGMTIGRKDNDGHYCPENCRWETDIEQANNRSNNRMLEYGGIVLTVAQWARRVGMSRPALQSRIDRDWPLELALDHKVKRRPREPMVKVEPAWKAATLTCEKCGAFFAPISSRSRCCSEPCRKAVTKRESHARNREAINERRRLRHAEKAGHPKHPLARGKHKVPKNAPLIPWRTA